MIQYKFKTQQSNFQQTEYYMPFSFFIFIRDDEIFYKITHTYIFLTQFMYINIKDNNTLRQPIIIIYITCDNITTFNQQKITIII